MASLWKGEGAVLEDDSNLVFVGLLNLFQRGQDSRTEGALELAEFNDGDRRVLRALSIARANRDDGAVTTHSFHSIRSVCAV